MLSRPPPAAEHRLTRQVRERFVDALDALIVELMGLIQTRLANLAQGGLREASIADVQLAMETQVNFQRQRQAWVSSVRQGWREALGTQASSAAASQLSGLGLVDDEIVERKIIASRIGAAVLDAASGEFNTLRLRIQSLEHSRDLSQRDVLRPETFALLLVKAWTDCDLTRPMWTLVHSTVMQAMAKRLTAAYQDANAWLVEQGVKAEIDLKTMVRRADDEGGGGGGGPSGTRQRTPARRGPGGAGAAGGAPAPGQWDAGADAGQWGAARGPAPRHSSQATRIDAPLNAPSHYGGGTNWRHGDVPPVRASALAHAAEETRMLTTASPMSRVRQRAQGVLGQLRRLLSDRVSDFDPAAAAGAPSPPLARALAEATPYAVTELMDLGATNTGAAAPSAANVQAVATRLRQRASELKAKAEKPSEKAVIEIVALMFQAILAEERIPANIRVWFARMQIPVLRLALAEPDFFATLQHPARQLIDRMGACALGFNAGQVGGSRLEREIKRIVQVIEQYPETGRRVYQLVLEEFKKFLGQSLVETGGAQEVASLAQQVEQKEALAIQYTIDLRRMLESVAVPEDVREFLFRIWSDVLAMAAVRRGPQAEETLRYKQAAADLVWAVSPKSDRTERSRVVQQLSSLLHRLREGMETLGIESDAQDARIKQINSAVMQAFVSRGEGLSDAKLAELSRSLAGLEDVVSDDAEGDVLLDPGVIELMFGAESDALEVIASGGSLPSEGMLQWAQSLELGTWFALDHQGHVSQVQYVWRSRRGQLHLFSAGTGTSYLVQTRRMASYLQAGLLVPVEDETLTVRATRKALEKLNAEPDQLLH